MVGAVEGGVVSVIAKNMFAGQVSNGWLNAAVAVLSGAPAFANVTSFLWAALSHGRNKIRFLCALQLACVLFPQPAPCPKGGRTCLEFGISALVFGATLATVGRTRRRLRPYDADDEGGERVGLV